MVDEIRASPEFADCLDPQSYLASQALAVDLLVVGWLGLVYPSVRKIGGANVVCFRSAAIGNVHFGSTF